MPSAESLNRGLAQSGRKWLIRALFIGCLSCSGNVALSADNIAGLSEQPLAPRSMPQGATLFTELSPEQTGVVTENKYADPKMWSELYHEFEVGEIGTGVAIGDYDGDGRPDIFVVSKTESCRLFRNLGNFKFEDVTEKAGVADHGADAGIWKQGATFVDINNDGLLDIYVCRFNAPNLLYINQGNGTFKESAHAYGLDVKDASVMAAFCDYDRDGWLDVFIQTNLLDEAGHPNGQRNYLFHNNRDGTFTDVTTKAGISGEAQGHSAIWWDYDGDGWPDLYVANDFAAPDKLYHNNKDGTFTNTINEVVPRMTFSSMGADLGDVNNDGLMDLIVGDMASSTHEKDQRGMVNSRSQASEPPDGSSQAQQNYRNSLYINTGTGRFLEASFMAGLAATDWTWGMRLEDLDNDGKLDLFVTNGMHRESTNADLLAQQMSSESPAERIQIMRNSPVMKETHFAFRNLGNLQFQDVSAAWGLNKRGVSFGTAFGDLDGDGDLDVVYTNYQGGLTILRNDNQTGHRVIIDLRGKRSNRFGVGSTVRIETASGKQIRQLVLARGILSSSEPMIHFGLGDDTIINKLTVTWPTGRNQTYTNLPVDRRFTITESDAPTVPFSEEGSSSAHAQFSEVSKSLGLNFLSREDAVDEVAQQRLLPMRLNRRGPALAVADLAGDGQDDIILGGTTASPARIIQRSSTGQYISGDLSALMAGSPVDDGPILIFDADGDGRNDVLFTKGGNNLPAGAPEYQPKLFLNDGHSGLRAAANESLPALPISVGAAAAADFNHDGRLGVFLGGRVSPGQYPLAPKSALLENRAGQFEDVTDTLAPGLREIGMVTGALWTDVDGDGWMDLLITLEWGKVRYFHNQQGKGFEDWTDKAGFGSAGTGWWNSIAAADFNGDGKPDYVVGNVGLNTQYHADPAHPAVLFFGDFSDNGAEPQIVEGYYEGERLYPWRSKRDLSAAIPMVRKRYPQNNAYARATLPEIFGKAKLEAAQKFAATELRSGVFLSQPDGTYRFEPLPRLAQIAPIYGMVAGDFDGDGKADIYAVQNSFAPVPEIGRFDGGLSLFLRGDGHGHFTAVAPAESGLVVPGDAKALAVVDLDQNGWPDFLLTRNYNTTQAYLNAGIPGRRSVSIRLLGPAGNLSAVGARISAESKDGATQTSEVYAGSGYYTQSSATVFFGSPAENPLQKIRIRWPSGQQSEYPVPAKETILIFRAPSP